MEGLIVNFNPRLSTRHRLGILFFKYKSNNISEDWNYSLKCFSCTGFAMSIRYDEKNEQLK